jgi:peptidoglycan/LPS O-acetylase OafA/YrhL
VPPLGSFCPGLLVFLALRPEARARGGWWAWLRTLAARPLPAFALVGVLWLLSQELHWETDPLAFAAFYPLVGLASGLALAAVLSGSWLAGVRRVLAPIGLVSYGIYLWHWVVLAVLLDHRVYPVGSFAAVASVIHALVLLALTLPLALASWLFVERPLLRRTTAWDRPPAPAPEPTPASTAAPAPEAVS